MIATVVWVSRRAKLATVVALALVGCAVSVANATGGSVGACCLPNGQCLSVVAFDCEAQGGDFSGPDTSCVMIECPTASLPAPLLSLFGVVAAIGALAGLGVYRLVVRPPAA
ncbi:MAG: hypothetical protein ACRERC_08565 [Candidatus Binatia bacterium]